MTTAIGDKEGMLQELRTVTVGCVAPPDYGNNPQGWLKEYLAEYAWQIQRDIWVSVHRNRATAVLSCNNSGKTWLAARIVVWFILTHWAQGVRVVTTAPTAAQVSLLLWQEIRAAYTRAKALGRPTPGRIIGSPFPQWKIGDVTVAFGRKPADHEIAAMQGVHARWVLAVGDEAGGLSQAIFDAFDKITTNANARILLIGNPDDRTAPFGKVTATGSGWHVIRIDGLRTPNMTRDQIIGPDPDRPRYPLTAALMRHEGIPFNREQLPGDLEPVMRDNLLAPLWVEERFTRWCGIDPGDAVARFGGPHTAALGQYIADSAAASQLFTAAVRGEFPDTAGDSVIPLGWVNRAMERWQDWHTGDVRRHIPPRALPAGRLVIGGDIATTNGADETVIAPRRGNVSMELHVYPESGDTHRTAERFLEHGASEPQTVVVVDGIGIGAGVRDVLRNEHGVTVVSFEAYLQSGRRDRWGEFRFVNDRAAAWWRMRELLDPVRGTGLCLPPDEKLRDELVAPKWWVTSSTQGGVIHVESKDDMRKRLKRSTDRADAVIQSYWVDGTPPQDPRSGGPRAVPWQQNNGHRDGDGRRQEATGHAGMVPYRLPTLGGD